MKSPSNSGVRADLELGISRFRKGGPRGGTLHLLIGSNVHWWNAEAAYAATLAALLQDAGHEVWVLTRPDSLNAEKLQARGLRILTEIDLNSNNPLQWLRSYQQLCDFLQTQQIDLIHAHRSEGYPLLAFARRKLGIPLVRTRGTARPLRQSWLNQKLYGDWTDATIAVGEVVAQQLRNALDFPTGQPSVIYYPAEDSTGSGNITGPDYRMEFGIPNDHTVLAFVGRIRPEKGVRLLLEAFRQLLTDFPKLTLLLLYRDTPSEIPEMQAVQADLQRLGVATHVRMDAEREDILSLMAFADVGVVSSIASEVICRVAVEFFSVGTPVVALPTGCLPEIIQNGETGALASVQSSEALAQALRLLLANSEHCALLSDNARRAAETRFAPQHMLDATLAVYRQLGVR